MKKFSELFPLNEKSINEDVEISIGADFLKVFKEKFPTLTFKADEVNLTQEWITKYGESLDDDKLNQYKEYLIGNDFASLKIEESEEVNEEVNEGTDHKKLVKKCQLIFKEEGFTDYLTIQTEKVINRIILEVINYLK